MLHTLAAVGWSIILVPLGAAALILLAIGGSRMGARGLLLGLAVLGAIACIALGIAWTSTREKVAGGFLILGGVAVLLGAAALSERPPPRQDPPSGRGAA